MSKKRLIIVSILLVLFLIVLTLVVTGNSGFIDNNIYNLVRSMSNSFFDKYFVFITHFGDTLTIVGVIFGFLLLSRNIYGILLGASACNSVILNTIIKHIVRRDRPNGLRLIEQGGYSFPSGHAMISICVYGLLLYFVFTKIKNKYLKCIISTLLFILIISIGVSRIFVGVHFASDVIAGYILASIQVILLVSFTDKYLGGK